MALAIFLLLEICLFVFEPRLVFLVLLMLVDEVACGYDF